MSQAKESDEGMGTEGFVGVFFVAFVFWEAEDFGFRIQKHPIGMKNALGAVQFLRKDGGW